MTTPRLLLTALVSLTIATTVFAQSCVLPDNGTGTVDLPPECPDGYIGHMSITDGFPAGTTLEIDAVLTDFSNILREPGGEPGSEVQGFDAYLYWEVSGTGDLDGFSRALVIPVIGQTRTGPRTPGDPVQSFPAEVYFIFGTLYGDLDFCALTIRAGTNYGLPSPGVTTLTELPGGDFAVDSFFDVTYVIEYEGCPASPLADYMGASLGTDRFQAGGNPTTVAGGDDAIPVPALRLRVVPNPFNPATTITYDLPEPGGKVSLCVYDVRGRRVRTLVNRRETGGSHSVTWNGLDDGGVASPSGIYFSILESGRDRAVGRMVLVR